MDFLDSCDLNVSKKRSRRVRSWYLYEQFKSLEKNQVVAAQKLKDRVDQDKILRQELLERRARRNLYDQSEAKDGKSKPARSVKSEDNKTSLCASDDFFESFSEHQEYFYRSAESESESSQVDCHTNYDEYKTIENNTIETDTVNSVTEIHSDDTITQDSNKNLCIENEDNLKQINYHFDEVHEHLDNLAQLTEIQSCKNSDTDSLYSYEDDEMRLVKMEDKNVYTQDNNIFAMWSKLVAFAYQIIQLNHGNCYYDYGSQFLTAILACDVLRRGVTKMCDILQPYVSPIKFATDRCECTGFKNVRRKLSGVKIRKKCFMQKSKPKKKMKPPIPTKKAQFARKYRSENWKPCPRHIICKPINQRQDPKSEPWRSVEKLSIDLENATPKSSKISRPSTIWPGFSSSSGSKSKRHCGCRSSKDICPMVKLSQYIDSILKDVNETHFI